MSSKIRHLRNPGECYGVSMFRAAEQRSFLRRQPEPQLYPPLAHNHRLVLQQPERVGVFLIGLRPRNKVDHHCFRPIVPQRKGFALIPTRRSQGKPSRGLLRTAKIDTAF